MRKLMALVGVTALTLLAATWLTAQEQKKRASPHEQTSGVIAGKKITIDYGRPYVKGRKIYGGLVPFGQVWRTGADEATTLNTPGDLMMGRIHVPAGTYSLFTIPGEKEWTLILNKTAKQWGAFKYDESQDLGRTTMKVEKLAQPVEQLTITIVPGSGNQGSLRIAWENTAAVAPIMVH